MIKTMKTLELNRKKIWEGNSSILDEAKKAGMKRVMSPKVN